MKANSANPQHRGSVPLLTALALAALGGCEGDGPAIEARPQTITFQAAPPLPLGGTATVAATASSGLAVHYGSATPSVCSVDRATGQVSARTVGTCVLSADQPGDTRYAPAAQATQSLPILFDPVQTIRFAAAPRLSWGGSARVSATASSGLPVAYGSLTPAVCLVGSGTGLVVSLSTGECVVSADQPGDGHFDPAPRALQTLAVSAPSAATVPGAPAEVEATAGDDPRTVRVSVGPTDSGGSPVSSYTVLSSPAGITGSGSSSPIVVTCPSSCAGHGFSAFATNALGAGATSALAPVVTAYEVVETFFEPDTQPRNTIFLGSFTLDSTSGTVSGLQGILSESMTGGPVAYPNDSMTWLSLGHQLVQAPATVGGVSGLWVATFLLDRTDTLSADPRFGGIDGWSPGSGSGLHSGFPGANPGNAYALIFVDPQNPTAPLSQAQIEPLAYADCTPGGMMGDTCMTGTTLAGAGSVGSMGGRPVSLRITRR
jgi:hypothetical protein